MTTINKRLVLILSIAFSVLALLLTWNSRGLASIYWMNFFRPQDYPKLTDLFNYLINLRTGVPPVLSAFEILTYQFFGNLYLIESLLYKVSLLSSFLISALFIPQKTWTIVFKLTVSVVLLWGVVLIHPGNPQVYDLLYPLFILLFLIFYHYAKKLQKTKSLFYIFMFLSGFFFSMTELVRSFFLPILVVVLTIVLFSCKQRFGSCKGLITFMLPIILLTGSWHLKLYLLNDGQVFMTNHTGFYMMYAWKMRFSRAGENVYLVDDEFHRIKLEGFSKEPEPVGRRWKNLNTRIHYENSEIIRRALISHIASRPWQSFRHALKRIDTVARPATAIYRHRPNHPILHHYRLLSRLAFLLLIVNLVLLGYRVIRSKSLWLLSAPENLLLIIAASSIFILAVGDAGEEARFFISVLPLLVAQQLPLVKSDAHLGGAGAS